MQHLPIGAVRDAPLPRNTILQGDVRARMRELPEHSIDCIITSPPYFGLRDYGHADQLGAEPDVAAWVENMRAVCKEAARVLKPTGALWLNLGDCYARSQVEGAPTKSLLLGPARLALALLRDGWIIRNQVVWAKTNPMPSSVRDRLTTTHEVVYLLVHSRRYFFDVDAIRQPLRSAAKQAATAAPRRYPPDGTRPTTRSVNSNGGLGGLQARGVAGHPLGKNPGDVWQISTANYRGSHFAVFPLALADIPIRATCPERVCVECGQPWKREPVDRQRERPAAGKLTAACTCGAPTKPGVVLDPFMGAGTVALAAEQRGRDWLGIELNPAFVALAEQRLAVWRADRAKSTR